MNEVRYASLSGNLLARKGAAKPAMRSHTMATRPVFEDDLGWDDMGTAAEPATDHVPSPITALTPSPKPIVPREAPEPVHVQQQAIADIFTPREPEPEAEPVAAAPVSAATVKAPSVRRPAVSAGRKAAFTLRLDADRHLRLRLASALSGSSSQVLVTNALDAFLNTMPDVARLADQVPPAPSDQD